MSKEKEARIQVILTEEERKEFKRIMLEEDITMSEWLRNKIKDKINDE